MGRVSIHAPAWGATRYPEVDFREVKCFNPRARVGRDLATGMMLPMRGMFQSTRPRGARPEALKAEEAALYSFNPRARVGRDAEFTDDIPF